MANHGWLNAKHSFSFANWYNPDRIHFGALRVLNDDIIAPGMGFGTHPHDNMEIITIPLKGSLAHKDSMGHSSVIRQGEVQVMSAGTGIQHSEYNASESEAINLFQIWIFPNKRNVEPRYDQFRIDESKMHNDFLQLISPDESGEGSWIHQDAWLFMAEADAEKTLEYKLHKPGNGVYVMNISGAFEVAGEQLNIRDAAGISETDSITIKTSEKSRLLLIEIPMEF